MKVQINKTHFVEVDNIDYIRETKNDVRVYLKNGYPKTLITNCSKSMLLLRMVNVGVKSSRIEELRDR